MKNNNHFPLRIFISIVIVLSLIIVIAPPISTSSASTYLQIIRNKQVIQNNLLQPINASGPTLTWNTFFGPGINTLGPKTYAQGNTLDGSGNAYVTGSSNGTWGTPVNGYSGGIYDAFVAKFDYSGNLIWNTFVGSPGEDHGNGIALDGNGNIYIVGVSNYSWGTPVDPITNGCSDIFAVKLNANGFLLWNTFMGSEGNGCETGNGIVVDWIGNAYVIGTVNGSWGTPINPYTGGWVSSVAKLSSNGARLWNTFLGSSGIDTGGAIALDGNSSLLVTGWSQGTWGTPINPTNGSDVYIASISTSGSLQWNTFLGAVADTYGGGIAIDGSGNIYVTGRSFATWGNPISKINNDGFGDAFVVKLNSGGVQEWNTFMGGQNEDYSRGITVDGSGNVYVTGESMATWGTPVNPYSDYFDVFIAGLNSDGVRQWNTFLGSIGGDGGYSIAVDESKNVYIVGYSDHSWGTPILPHYPGTNGFVAKLDFGKNLYDFKQNPNAYGGPDLWSNDNLFNVLTCPTMGAEGCAITAMADVISSYGLKTLPDQTPTNPGNLNSFLGQQLGENYTHSCLLYPQLAAESINYNLLYLDFPQVPINTRIQHIDDALENDNLVIVGVGGHYIVLYQKVDVPASDGSPDYLIMDPYWYPPNLGGDRSGQLLSETYGTVNDLEAVLEVAVIENKAANNNNSWIIVGHSPIELLITDPIGLQTGFNPATGTYVYDIDGSSYGLLPGLIDDSGIQPPLPDVLYFGQNNLATGEYIIQVIGIGSGQYSLDFGFASRSQAASFHTVNGMAIPGEIDTYTVNVVEGQPPAITQIVKIDIQPGITTNSINCKKNSVIPVALISTDTFDALSVDYKTVSFEGALELHNNHGVPQRHVGDVNGDGKLDLVFHFYSNSTDLTCNSTQGTLIGKTFDGLVIEGTDSIRMVR